MNNIEKFNHTVGILVDAYMKDKLERMNPCGCAGGTIVHHFIDESNYRWRMHWFARWHQDADQRSAELKLKTGYSPEELNQIENAFMGWLIDDITIVRIDDIFLGLMRTVDVLAEIHGIDISATQSAKQLFEKQTI